MRNNVFLLILVSMCQRHRDDGGEGDRMEGPRAMELEGKESISVQRARNQLRWAVGIVYRWVIIIIQWCEDQLQHRLTQLTDT